MNYIELIKRFWELDRLYSFSGNETRLYFYLVEQANCLCWQEWFWHKDDLASAYVGIAKDTLRSCRNKLKQCGLIDFVPGGKGQRDKTRYEILAPNTDPKPYPKGNPKSYPNADPLNKHKTKTKTIPPLSPDTGEAGFLNTEVDDPIPNTTPTDPPPALPEGKRKSCAKKKEPLDISYVEPSFQPIVADWLAYKSERGQTYRQQGVKACYIRLLKLSRNDSMVAREIINQSMANNWAGLFELKQPPNHDTRTTNSRTLPDNPQYRSDNDKF